MWRRHSKAAILIGGSSAILYVIWLMFSLVFTQEWNTPPIAARVVVFLLAFAILELYQVRTYGYLTDKKEGSAWLMLPASRAEKFVSMLLVSLIVVPLLFLVVFLLLDGFLSLVDPTYGESLVTGFNVAYTKFLEGMVHINNESPVNLTTSMLVIPTVVGYFANFQYFLLCGICFKRNKLVCAIAIVFGISTVLSLVSGFIIPGMFDGLPSDATDEMINNWVNVTMNISTALACITAVGLGWGIWHRIKTIQH